MYQEPHRASPCVTVVPSPHCPSCQFTFLPPSFPSPTKAPTGNPVPVLSPHTKDKRSLFLCPDPFLHLQYPLLFLAKQVMATWEPTSELPNESVWRHGQHGKTGRRQTEIRAVTSDGGRELDGTGGAPEWWVSWILHGVRAPHLADEGKLASPNVVTIQPEGEDSS